MNHNCQLQLHCNAQLQLPYLEVSKLCMLLVLYALKSINCNNSLAEYSNMVLLYLYNIFTYHV